MEEQAAAAQSEEQAAAAQSPPEEEQAAVAQSPAEEEQAAAGGASAAPDAPDDLPPQVITQLGIIMGWTKTFMDLQIGYKKRIRLKWTPRTEWIPLLFATVVFTRDTDDNSRVGEIALAKKNDIAYPTHTRRWIQGVVTKVEGKKTTVLVESSIEVYRKLFHQLTVTTRFLESDDFGVDSKIVFSTQRFKTSKNKWAAGIDTAEPDPDVEERNHIFAANTRLLGRTRTDMGANCVIGDRRVNAGMLGFDTNDVRFIDTTGPEKNTEHAQLHRQSLRGGVRRMGSGQYGTRCANENLS